jgi:RNA polymerase nonessential primary-like sigma factor
MLRVINGALLKDTTVSSDTEDDHEQSPGAAQDDILLVLPIPADSRAESPPSLRPSQRLPDIDACYRRDIARCKDLSREEEQCQARLAREGDREALRVLVEAHLKQVVRLARRYTDRGVPLADLIEEGNLGLLHAVRRFDPERGCRLSTYSFHWILLYIGQALRNQSRIVELPVRVTQEIRASRDVTRLLESTLDHAPRPAEIAEAVHRSPEYVGWLQQLSETLLSLDETGANDPEALVDTLVDEQQPDPVERLAEEALPQQLWGWLQSLKPNYREVIIRRYGLGGTPREKLQTIADRLGVCDSRVQQIQVKALQALRTIAVGEGFDVETLPR